MGAPGEHACVLCQRWLMCDAQCELLWGWSELWPAWKRGWRSPCGSWKRVKGPPEVIVYMFDVCAPMSTLMFEYVCRYQCLGTSQLAFSLYFKDHLYSIYNYR